VSATPVCLLVDDHDDTREGYAEFLQVNGFEVLAAATAEQFESLLAGVRPDAIVLDLQLPGIDGWDLAKRVKADPALRSIPLLAVSACVMPAERARAQEAGFDRFLPKPCDPVVMLAEIRRLLGRPA
jgi:two-component system, cell cycle response regulator DivK